MALSLRDWGSGRHGVNVQMLERTDCGNNPIMSGCVVFVKSWVTFKDVTGLSVATAGSCHLPTHWAASRWLAARTTQSHVTVQRYPHVPSQNRGCTVLAFNFELVLKKHPPCWLLVQLNS